MRPLFRETRGPLENQIRPFARAAQKPLRHINQASQPLATTTTSLTKGFNDLNLLFNALAYNPPGASDEGNLFWLSWLNHNTNAVFFTQDAGGPLRHGLVQLSCSTAGLAELVGGQNDFLQTLSDLSRVPTTAEINQHEADCPPSAP